MKTFDEAIEQLKVAIKQDYINWTTQGGKKELTGYFKESVENPQRLNKG